MALNTKLWTPTDTTAKLTQSNSNLVWAAGAAAWGDPATRSAYNFIRMAGLTFEVEVTPTSGTWHFGMHSSATLTNEIANYIRSTGTNLVAGIAATQTVLPPSLTAGTSYRFRLVFKTAGCLWYYSTDNGKTWYCIWEEASTSATPLWAMLNSYQFVGSNGLVVVFKGTLTDPVINATPSAPTLTVGSELITNAGLEAPYAGGIAANWSAVVASGVPSEETVDLHGGASAQKIVATAGREFLKGNDTTLAAGAWVKGSAWTKCLATGTISLVIRRAVGGTLLGNVALGGSIEGSYSQKTFTARVSAGDWGLGVDAESGQILFDDASQKAITLSSALAGGGDAGSKYGIFDFAVTVGATYQAGGLCCLDDAGTPANYLHAYVDRTDGKAYLLKVVAGVTTELIGTAITYGAADQLRVVVSPGTSGLSNAQVALYYDGAAVGTVQTVDLTNFGTLVRAFDTSEGATVAVTVNV